MRLPGDTSGCAGGDGLRSCRVMAGGRGRPPLQYGGRIRSAPTVFLRAAGAYRAARHIVPCRANWAADAARYVCRTQTRDTAAARQHDMLPFASTICGLCRATIPPFIPPFTQGGHRRARTQKPSPGYGEGGHGDARRACNGTAVTKRSGVEFRLRWMRSTRRKAERFSRMNCACGAYGAWNGPLLRRSVFDGQKTAYL